jgi:UDP-N-acetylmuramoylalanine-D-glutamate ligase
MQPQVLVITSARFTWNVAAHLFIDMLYPPGTKILSIAVTGTNGKTTTTRYSTYCKNSIKL